MTTGAEQSADKWAVFSDEEVALIASFASVTTQQIRGIEMLVLMKKATE